MEVAQLDTALQKLVGVNVPALPATAALLLSSWKDDLSGLSASSQDVVARLQSQQVAAASVESYVKKHKIALAAGDSAAKADLVTVLAQNGMTESATRVLPAGTAFTIDNGRCLSVNDVGGANSVVATATSALCSNAEEQRWVMDARGAIHNVALPGLCLTAATPATLTNCSVTTGSQVWTLESDGHLKSATSSYLDLYKHLTPSTPGMYGKGSGSNQIWKGLSESSNPALVTLSPATLKLVHSLELDPA